MVSHPATNERHSGIPACTEDFTNQTGECMKAVTSSQARQAHHRDGMAISSCFFYKVVEVSNTYMSGMNK